MTLRETGRLVSYPGVSWIIREGWHVCNTGVNKNRSLYRGLHYIEVHYIVFNFFNFQLYLNLENIAKDTLGLACS